MPREIRCPHSDCGIVIKVSDDISEEKALCPGCQRDVSVQPQPSQKFNNLAIVEDIGVRQPAEVSSQAVPPKSNKKRAYIGIAIGIGALVVVLLGVLIAVAINKAIIAQKQSLCRSNLSQMSWALKQYNNEFQVFPASLSMASSYMW